MAACELANTLILRWIGAVCTMTKMGKSDGEASVTETRANDGDAPIPDLPCLSPNGEVRPNPIRPTIVLPPGRTIMPAVSNYACTIVMAAIIACANAADAQETKVKLPKVIVLAQAAPAPPYMRDPWKAYARNPYFGRYRVEEDKFAEVPCTATRIAFAPGGKCLQGYRLTPADVITDTGHSPCDLALDVVSATTGRLSIEADILAMDPYKVTAEGSPPRSCYVHGYMGYDQEDFQDMNQVTRRGDNWRNLQINGQERSIEFSDGPHNCVAILRPGPVWRGGYTYMMHASICRTDVAALQAQDIAYVLGALQTRTHDPVGNLRRADDPIYGQAGGSR
jgi:hypothetical protein